MSSNLKRIRIGTRGSPLALTQTQMVRSELARVAPYLETEVIVIKTSGDWTPGEGDVRLKDSEGGKGLFAKEIEAALMGGEVDIGVHSMKDMDSHLPALLSISHMLKRANPFDALLLGKSIKNQNLMTLNSQNFLMALPKNAVIGSSSVRRQAFLLSQRPDLQIVPLRGNVHTRIEKLAAGQVDVTLLAVAGLERLGLEYVIDRELTADEMLPSAGQGAVGIEIRTADTVISSLLDQINHTETVLCVTAERAALRVLDGSCHTPIGAYAIFEEGEMILRLALAALDGSEIHTENDRAKSIKTIQDADDFGAALGVKLKAKVPPSFLMQRIAV